jgi:hypothetical protein
MDFYDRLFIKTRRLMMYKHLFNINFILLSCHAVAENATTIKAPEITEPLYAGIFQGSCNSLNLRKLETLDDLESRGTSTCTYITGQTFNPNNPKTVLKAWHMGSAVLSLVAFQSKGIPVKCGIGMDQKTMVIVNGENGLKCTLPPEPPVPAPVEEPTPVEVEDPAPAEVEEPAPVKVPDPAPVAVQAPPVYGPPAYAYAPPYGPPAYPPQYGPPAYPPAYAYAYPPQYAPPAYVYPPAPLPATPQIVPVPAPAYVAPAETSAPTEQRVQNPVSAPAIQDDSGVDGAQEEVDDLTNPDNPDS